ncbi:MAG: V-type ATP synthase subunit K [Clostridiales bacterium]|nr:V-type ATP synthase subunit K [Clostridiales bacterium]
MEAQALAILGLAICAGLCGAGSAIGLYHTGSAASGVLAEDPKKFSKVLILVVLPATQGIYGFVLAIIGMGNVSAAMTAMEGAKIFAAAMPLAITGLISGIYQGKTAVGGIYAVARNEKLSGKLILFPAMVETYAILGLVISILLMS